MLGLGCRIRALMEGQMQSPAALMSFKQRTIIVSGLRRTQLVIQRVSLDNKSFSILHVSHSVICRCAPSSSLPTGYVNVVFHDSGFPVNTFPRLKCAFQNRNLLRTVVLGSGCWVLWSKCNRISTHKGAAASYLSNAL